MKIGITCYPTYGGSGAVATELGIALAARGHHVHFITYQQPFRLPSFLPRVWFHEVDVGRYPLFEYPPYDLALAVRMHEVVRDHQLDILHCHYAIPHATSAWIARSMLREEGRDVKVVTTLHGTDITIVGQERSFFTITKFSIEKSHAVTAVSQYLREETYRAFGCTGCNVGVIPNFIDPVEFDRSRHVFPIPADVIAGRKVIMHISNFRPVKRVRDIVRTFALITREVPSVLVMVGDGPERVEAETEARELGVADAVLFLGKIDPIAPLLAGADLFLLTSDKESFGLSALEALASGVPVIGAHAGGLPEVVTDGVTGYLRPVGDVEGMAAAGVQLLSDPARWQAMSAAGAADARRRFSEDAIVAQYESLYERTLST
ncbi:MAG TPA: N-acetyl-alpha-D-glucosaminyl L-malate synthase BshA [Gemmatimonas aurantiaca]|uniref:N-acetyl-alpha-D-glucosaminyl L-malate synthase BshA n=2 Tax=Gemmatimonas aurantiaca TaxID=173480 RepID=A0A3D4V843_9BACT|nr:N-acetyl-alpha-D-glucosaminyl L-malate synthase BshA [Gemmatimonas aurantiaca]BAH38574.1 putative glycosyltransferase [Gemmatimonas aurantiaca T-27]HCT57303.1 N-acetyl-alpha-D-glucosaminyl L-malate synthase BshA [Gemmatimonas aurantiaca]